MSSRINNPMAAIFKNLAISLGFMLIGLIVGMNFVPPSFVFYANKIFMFLMIILVVMALFSRKSIIPRRFSMSFVFLFTFIDGILMYPLITYYLRSLGIGVVISILIGAIVLFGILARISYKKEPGHFLGMGSILFSGLIALLILSVVNIFFNSSITGMIISAVGVVIFSGYVLYDISLIKYDISRGNINDSSDLSIHVLNLYIDFINIVLDLLNIADFLDNR